MKFNMIDPSLSFAIISLSIECTEFLTYSLYVEKNKTTPLELKNKFSDIMKIMFNICTYLPISSSFEKVYDVAKNDIENKEMDEWVSAENIFLFSTSLCILSGKILSSTRDFQFVTGDQKKFTEDVLTHALYFCKTCIKLSEILKVDTEEIKKTIFEK